MKINRHYLTGEEISFIINAMLEKETAIEREIVKVGLVLQFIADDLGEYEDCNALYDEAMKNGIALENHVNNYKDIDKIFAQETSVEKILSDFLTKMEGELKTSLDKLDLNSAVKQLEEIAKNDTNTQKRKSKNIS